MADSSGLGPVRADVVRPRMQRGKCCRCNGNATCVRCECTKDGRQCRSCLPSRKNRCRNFSAASLPSSSQSGDDTGSSTITATQDHRAPQPAAASSAVSAECRADPPCGTNPDNVPITGDDAVNDSPAVDLPATLDDSHQAITAARTADALRRDGAVLATLDQSQPAGADELRTNEVDVPGGLAVPVDCLRDPVADPQPQARVDSSGALEATIPDLPEYAEVLRVNFALGTMTAEESARVINSAYDEAVHFRPNTFDVPNGSGGKEFVNLLSQYLLVFGNAGTYQGQALKIAMLFQMLLLQKPFQSNPSSYAKCLKRRLELWRVGAIPKLMEEFRTIHEQLAKHQQRHEKSNPDGAKRFASLVTEGKLGTALAHLEEDASMGVLNLDDRIGNDTVRDILTAKHPPAAPAHPVAISQGDPPAPPHPIRFESLTRDVVRRAALNTHGAAGPSGVDADTWRRMCTGFGDASNDLCDAMASCARRLATSFVDPSSLQAYVSCRLISLDKKPGVRPIGIGEVLRRILGKAVLYLLRDDIQEAAGSLQLCAGHECGIEAAIHAMKSVFDDDETEGLLLADATNAFNCLNREVYLRNIQHICPALSSIAINTYRQPARLIVGGEVILSSEGTTQGDPIAMPLYALGVLPLLKLVTTAGTVQAWFADDSGAGGKLAPLRSWWSSLTDQGPSYGYHLNPSKSVLLVKPGCYDRAKELFADTGVDIRVDGCRYLGAAIGTPAFLQSFLDAKAKSWLGQVERLSDIAQSQPQAAYSAFTNGLQNKWSFLCRTMPNAATALAPVEKIIADKFIHAITGRLVNAEDRALLALPCRHGGLGVVNPTELSSQYELSCRITESLQHNIKQQVVELGDALHDVYAAKKQVQTAARNTIRAHALVLHSSLTPEKRRIVDLAAEKGASSWLTCRPLKRHGFALSKAEFTQDNYRNPLAHARRGLMMVRMPQCRP